jgi:hypothetical protein
MPAMHIIIPQFWNYEVVIFIGRKDGNKFCAKADNLFSGKFLNVACRRMVAGCNEQ